MMGHLVIDANPIQDISGADRAAALAVGIKRIGLSCLPWDDECREFQARVERMNTLSLGEQDNTWPAMSDEALLQNLDTWLLPWLDGMGSIKAVKQINLLKALMAMLDYRQLSYLQTGNPVLSVRLQEMLGCAENPAIAKGQIPLKVELLSPARRPVQVTTDLANFWSNSYPAVKKDMAGRYPKHHWPDDPLSAEPTTRTKRR